MSRMRSMLDLGPKAAAAPAPSKDQRASKACSGCRTRKVRCDVLKTGTPCSKCRADGFECNILARKKRCAPGKRRHYSRTPRTGNCGEDSQPAAPPTDNIAQHIVRHQIPHYPLLSGFTERNDERVSVLPHNQPPAPALNSMGKAPPRLILPSLSHEDLQYLTLKGAFDLPPKRLLDDLVANYFRVFHPFFPVVDKQAFFLQFNGPNSLDGIRGCGISLLLLQSIIFTSCAVSLAPINHFNRDPDCLQVY